MFGFALWDRPRRRLFLARDRVGKKLLYYTHADGDFVFATRKKIGRQVCCSHAINRLSDTL